MSLDVPRCQALFRGKNGLKMCGKPIQYINGLLYDGWEHTIPYTNHIVVEDPDWEVDEQHKQVVRAYTELRLK